MKTSSVLVFILNLYKVYNKANFVHNIDISVSLYFPCWKKVNAFHYQLLSCFKAKFFLYVCPPQGYPDTTINPEPLLEYLLEGLG